MSDNFDLIPTDMRTYNQWVVWKLEDREGTKPTKVLYCPHTGRKAATDNPATWATFEQAVECARAQNEVYNGVGFVFTENDPFAGIDLDDPYEKNPDGTLKHADPEAVLRVQLKIYDMFDSYTEKSPSGTGLHIICRGHTPNGRRRGGIELYSSGRFFTMTGDVYRDAPIQELQTLTSTLWHELGGKVNEYTHGGDLVEKLTDAEVIEKASSAVNGEKFLSLHAGEFSNYPSQSEADQAYMNFLAFYSQHRNQLMRMFRASPLGKREKAQRNTYLSGGRYGLIDKAFDRMLPPIDLDGFKNQVADALAAAAKSDAPAATLNTGAPALNIGVGTPHIDLTAQIARAMAGPAAPAAVVPQALPATYKAPTKQAPVTFPPGLLGEIADFIYRSAPRPVPEIALAGAIGLMAGICGRSYNYSGTGLNQYVLMLAATGRGKEAISSGVSRLMSALTEVDTLNDGPAKMAPVPAAREFIGPSSLPSGPGLMKVFKEQKSFLSIVGEIGLWMQRINHPRANAADISVKTVLLDLYGKSAKGNTAGGSAYSDKDKNTGAVKSPALTFLGEGTPSTFFASLDEMLIAQGFLPRFLTLHYDGPRVPLNKAHGDVRPSAGLVTRLSTVAINCLTLNNADHVNNVQIDPDALELLDTIDTKADALMNDPDRAAVLDELYNRCHMKVFKLAALVAVGLNPDMPTITIEAVEWANDIVQRDIDLYVRKFEAGDVGSDTGESKQVRDVISVVQMYLTRGFDDVSKYGAKRDMHADHVIPYTYLQRRLVAVASFRHDRIGSTNAIKRVLQSMLDEGSIVEVGRADLGKYNARGKAYVVGDVSRFV
jgi:hypothetical protein